MSNLEKLQWIPKLLDAYLEVRKSIEAQREGNGGGEEAAVPVHVPVHVPVTTEPQATPPQAAVLHAVPAVRKRKAKRLPLQQQVRETRRQLARLASMQQHLRDLQGRLDRQLAALEKRVVSENGPRKQPQGVPTTPTLFARDK